jgi:hypothetical protein
MTRHNQLRAQTAITPSQSARDLAPLHTWIVISRSVGPTCRGRHQLNGRNIDLFNPSAAAPSYHPGGPRLAKSRKIHSPDPVGRGFVLRGLSGACRQPKLFIKTERRLLALKG